MNWYEMVKEMHLAFEHPVGEAVEGYRAGMPVGWRVARAGFIIEELAELVLAKTLVDQIDALVDCMYFAVGTMVIGGMEHLWKQPVLETRASDYSGILDTHQKLVTLSLTSQYADNFAMVDLWHLQHEALEAIISCCLRGFSVLGLDPDPFFAIVHKANMAKLWPDGKPRYREHDKKIVKPPGWVSPKVAIASEVERQRRSAAIEAGLRWQNDGIKAR